MVAHQRAGEDREIKNFDLENYGRLKSSIVEPQDLELKPLPEHLEYAFLEGGSKLLFIIASDLIAEQKDKLLSVLKLLIVRESSHLSVSTRTRRILSDYEMPQFTGEEFSVQAPTVPKNNFEIKARTIGMVHNSMKFDGLADEDPHAHLSCIL